MSVKWGRIEMSGADPDNEDDAKINGLSKF
jgi:hypothetical protein